MITLLNFSKKYNQRTVLDIDQWIFEKGLYLLKGVNGSGKSTLLQSMAARLSFEGQIRVNEVFIKKSPQYCRQKVSYSAAEPLFPEFLTGRHLLGFFTKAKGASPWRLESLIEGFAADAFLDNPTGAYSSGMLKKLSLLLALTGEPEWVLLDEPYNGLDIQSADRLSSFIEDLYDNYKVAFIISSHQSHQDLGAGYQQTLLLEKGKLEIL